MKLSSPQRLQSMLLGDLLQVSDHRLRSILIRPRLHLQSVDPAEHVPPCLIVRLGLLPRRRDRHGIAVQELGTGPQSMHHMISHITGLDRAPHTSTPLFALGLVIGKTAAS